MCANSNAAKAANKNALIQHRYRMWSRFHKTLQAYGRYGTQKVQGKLEQYQINQGLFRSWSAAQGKLNAIKDKVMVANTKGFVQSLKQSQWAKLVTSGRTGKSIERFGIMEEGALGRYFADNINKYYEARDKTKAGMKYARLMASSKIDQSFAKTWTAPTPDIQMAAPAMRSTSMFSDILGFAGTVANVSSMWATGGIFGSDRRLKTDIKKIGTSIKGYNIYRYKYLDQSEEYIGAMADEVFKKNPEAVFRMDNGYMGVDYSKIDVEFKEVVSNAKS